MSGTGSQRTPVAVRVTRVGRWNATSPAVRMFHVKHWPAPASADMANTRRERVRDIRELKSSVLDSPGQPMTT
jgi:hypothetical protein